MSSMVRVARKWFRSLLAALLLVALILPAQPAMAAKIVRNPIIGADLPGLRSGEIVFIGGVEHRMHILTDKAGTTSMTVSLWYAPGTSNDWRRASTRLAKSPNNPGHDYYFTLPIDPQLTSVRLKLNASFDPVLGSPTKDEVIVGPYEVRQPGQMTGLKGTPNSDGTVTLRWKHNTNMAKHYSIERYGASFKMFTYTPTEKIGSTIVWHDDTVDPKKRASYSYKIRPILADMYEPFGVPGFHHASVDLITTPPQPTCALCEIELHTNVSKYLRDAILNGQQNYSVTGVKVGTTSATLKVGETKQLQATVMPDTAANKNVFWATDNPDVATVDVTGLVRAIGEGEANISVQTEDGAFVATSNVAVVEEMPDSYKIKFVDVPGSHWAASVIGMASEFDIVHGDPGGTFRPEGTVTRAEFAKMIVVGLGLEGKAAPPLTFADTASIPDWAQGYVAVAVSEGIIKGLDGNRFGPAQQITREQMAVMVVRALGAKPAGSLSADDAASTSDWALADVQTALERGMLLRRDTTGAGSSAGALLPQAFGTRAEAAQAVVSLRLQITGP